MIFTGSAVALVTPFNEDNTPNFEKIKDGNVLLVGIGEATTTAAKPSGVGR